jgi:uncharacterized phiE125 gp8 family phage protein
MALVRTAGPALEPVSLIEVKAHLRLTSDDEDALISLLITVAREALERRLERAFIAQGWTLWLDQWPDSHAVALPMRPLRTVTAVRTYSGSHSATTMAPAQYYIDAVSVPGRLIRSISSWPLPGRTANGVEITFTAGHGEAASEVPAELRQAILLLVADLFENRDAIATPILSPAVLDLIAPFRAWRL